MLSINDYMGILRYYLGCITLIVVFGAPAMPADVYWLDRFGNISWNEERGRLSSFAQQILNSEEGVGYIFINAGKYLAKVRQKLVEFEQRIF